MRAAALQALEQKSDRGAGIRRAHDRSDNRSTGRGSRADLRDVRNRNTANCDDRDADCPCDGVEPCRSNAFVRCIFLGRCPKDRTAADVIGTITFGRPCRVWIIRRIADEKAGRHDPAGGSNGYIIRAQMHAIGPGDAGDIDAIVYE
jgi:hypothetical protein